MTPKYPDSDVALKTDLRTVGVGVYYVFLKRLITVGGLVGPPYFPILTAVFGIAGLSDFCLLKL